MSKTKGQTFRYRFGNETKTFWYHYRICLLENRLFRFGPKSVLLDQIDNDLFRWGRFGNYNSDILVSFLLEVGTFVERLWNVCPLLFWHSLREYVLHRHGSLKGLAIPTVGAKCSAASYCQLEQHLQFIWCDGNLQWQASPELCVKLCGMERSWMVLPGSWISAKYF